MPPFNLPALPLQKLLIPLVGVLVAAGMGFGLMTQKQQLERVQQQLHISRQEGAQLESRNQELDQQIATLQADRKALEERLSSVRTQLASSTTDLERLRVSLDETTKQYEQTSQDRSQFQAQVTSLTGERDQFKQQAEQLGERNAELERGISRLRERLVLLDRDYRQVTEKLERIETTPPPSLDIVGMIGPPPTPTYAPTGKHPASAMSGAVELPPIVVRKNQAGVSIPIRGRLLEVSESHNFVVVDQGSEDGVYVGLIFDIIRGGDTIGRIVVVRVRPQLSACDIIRAKTPGPLQVGDIAVQSGDVSR
jgi:cell division protein FtsB